MPLQKIASDTRLMAETIADLPHATRRALLITSVSIVIIGTFLFWPDIPAVIGFVVGLNLMMYAFVALTASDVHGSFDDGEWDGYGDGEWDDNDETDGWVD